MIPPDSAARTQAHTALERITSLTAHAPYDTYSAWPQAILRYATIARQNPARILPWLHRIDPAKLSTERYNDIPSPRARWYSATSRALLDSGRAHDAITLCNAALADGCLTDREATFIRYRIGKAQLANGQPQQAYDTLAALRSQLQAWYLDASIAAALADLGRHHEAIVACQAALAARGGQLASRIQTLSLLTRLLRADGHALTEPHLQYVRQLRTDRRWPPDRELEHLAAALGLPAVTPQGNGRTQPPVEVASFWRATKDQQRHTGTIATVFGHGRAGFLATEDGQRLYFSVGEHGPSPTVGLRVSFRIVASYDRRRDAGLSV